MNRKRGEGLSLKGGKGGGGKELELGGISLVSQGEVLLFLLFKQAKL